jgi:hypothetical protein
LPFHEGRTLFAGYQLLKEDPASNMMSVTKHEVRHVIWQLCRGTAFLLRAFIACVAAFPSWSAALMSLQQLNRSERLLADQQ